ncbi:MAG: hemerythrin domain-containing protein [Gammaproteobacteria bacterium]|nr:hemerythrin domain-containing protein [Gammaproteobacteria bacterium]
MYTPGDLPKRLVEWHSPRINRWERLCITAGMLAIEMREASGTACERLEAGESRWIAPGVRWRVAETRPDTRFEFEVHADTLGQADAPQTLRSELLDAAGRVTAADSEGLNAWAHELAPGERRVVGGGFELNGSIVHALTDDGRFFWHPLADGPGGFAALIAHAERPFGLAEYLGRDHAVIEAALAGSLRGDGEYKRWLLATLERHLHIEEELLFPAYLEAGGREAWVHGLQNEHKYLRQYLADLDDPGNRRKFLRLLDGHDEKEERVVYPDILEHLGARAAALLVKSKTFPIPAVMHTRVQES